MAAILKTFAGLNFYTRTCFIDYYHISFKKSHQTLRPRSCRVNQKFGPWISDYFFYQNLRPKLGLKLSIPLSEKHVRKMYTPYTPLLCSKTKVCRGISIFPIFVPKHRFTADGTR